MQLLVKFSRSVLVNAGISYDVNTIQYNTIQYNTTSDLVRRLQIERRRITMSGTLKNDKTCILILQVLVIFSTRVLINAGISKDFKKCIDKCRY